MTHQASVPPHSYRKPSVAPRRVTEPTPVLNSSKSRFMDRLDSLPNQSVFFKKVGQRFVKVSESQFLQLFFQHLGGFSQDFKRQQDLHKDDDVFSADFEDVALGLRLHFATKGSHLCLTIYCTDAVSQTIAAHKKEIMGILTQAFSGKEISLKLASRP